MDCEGRPGAQDEEEVIEDRGDVLPPILLRSFWSVVVTVLTFQTFVFTS